MKKEIVSSITLKNYHIRPLVQILDVPLHGQQARSRNRITSIFTERGRDLEKARLDLIKKFGKKDKEGNTEIDPITKNYNLENPAEFQKEFQAMMSEDSVFDILPSNRDDFKRIKEVVLDCKIDFDINGTTVYDEICQVFEKL